MVKAVIFDLDDTLISEKEYIKSGYMHISNILHQKYGVHQETCYNDLLYIFNESPRKVFDRLLTSYEIDYMPEEIMGLISAYREHYPTISFYSDVLPCIQLLKNKGILTGVITDGYAFGQRQKLKVLNAESLFNEIIVTDELGRDYWKPHPRAFELMSSKLNVSFEDMTYVGDNPEKDFYISKLYPITTIRIHRKGVHQNKSYFEGILEHNSYNSLSDFAVTVT
ncbi:HAD hydrolase-like protein [Paenibacillus sp. MMS20-IR301]|uniref:HAD family hydrolase n=1 Tax=Paenibacillus sp. MMS20-IR301 TaxID=2895946 RepID=UPI0028E6716B|nr:HAD hydrolase-like protein [Paenibacillus sp. MMS20-IR301]WNS43526.1 HAD hydrolase-like protein [Paenibacillus sp. MMS20-IR301]